MDIIHAHNDRNQEFSLGVGGASHLLPTPPITDSLLIPTPSRISVTIRDIHTLYIHERLVIQ